MFEDVIFTNSFYNDKLMTVLKSDNNELMFCCNYIDETTVVVLNDLILKSVHLWMENIYSRSRGIYYGFMLFI
ncbi:MAG: hypothetical protein J6A25_02750 [Lachnospiraceae bacterium]|nr:hypothetical protein [Lachnospiraceae bacterium]